MKRMLSFTLVCIIALFMLAACSQNGSETVSQGQQGAQEQTQNESAPAPQEPEELPYEPAVLTGEKYEGDYPQETRFVAAMINNISNNFSHDVRPQSGLSEADILVEIMVEGGITRFLALFPDYENLPEKFGPIRSARDQFFQLFLPFQPLYVHIGESGVQTTFKELYEYEDMDVDLDTTGHRFTDQALASQGKETWEIAYTTNDMVNEAIEMTDKDTERTYTSTFFNFVHYDDPERQLTGDVNGANSVAHRVDIHHSDAYATFFTYDEAKGKYLMSQYSQAKGGEHETVDANNNQQLEFENVVVLFTDIYLAPGHEASGLQYVEYAHGGVGYYFSNGQAEEVRWAKGAASNVLRVLDKFGNETDVQINVGKTYLTMVDLSTFESPNTLFTYYNDTVQTGDASSEATP